MQIKNIQDLQKKYGKGKGMVVRMDNDCSYVYASPADEENGNDVFEGQGYQDCEDLWKTAFPDADVEWV